MYRSYKSFAYPFLSFLSIRFLFFFDQRQSKIWRYHQSQCRKRSQNWFRSRCRSCIRFKTKVGATNQKAIGQLLVGCIQTFRKKLHDALIRKRIEKLHYLVLFQHDNASPYSWGISRAVLQVYRCELLPHVPYSPDFFFSSVNLKKT